MSGPSPNRKPPSRSGSWRSKARAAPVATVSHIFGAPVNSTLCVSAISTLPRSPLRHELSRQNSASSLQSSMGSSQKRGRDDFIDSAPAELDVFVVSPDIESSKKARTEESDQTPGAGPSDLSSKPSINGSALSDAFRPPASSPRSSWLEALYRPTNQSSGSLAEPIASSAPALTNDISTDEVSIFSTAVELLPGQPVEVAQPPIPEPSTISVEFKPLRHSASSRSGISSWFGGGQSAAPLPASTSKKDLAATQPLELTPTSEVNQTTADPLPNQPSLMDSSPVQSSTLINASTPRFSLKLPLLGASKVRIEDIIVPAPHVQITHEGDVTTLPPLSRSETTTSINGDHESVKTVSPEPAPLPPPTSASYIPSSWWGYIGLASSTPLPVSPNVAPSLRSNTDVTEMVLDNAQSILPPEVVGYTIAPENDRPPPEVLSGETTGSRASWMASLVGWGPQPNAIVNEVDKPTASDNLTEAELVKQEALAGPDQSPVAPEHIVNPVLSDATRASWVSFFSSRSRASVRAITDGMPAEMEVMDIDDEAPAASNDDSSQPPLVVPPSSKTSPSKAAAPSPRGKQGGTPVNTPSSATPAPPLTSSKDIKKKTAASTTAGKKDGPPKPKMPNLVLPTWGDTFYTTPRSLSPPVTSTFTRRINKAVSRLLAAPPAINPEIEAFQNERIKQLGTTRLALQLEEQSQRRIIRSVGADLPRAWSVLEDSGVGTTPSTLKRVVVIGIHGWFPGIIMRTVLGEPTGTSKKFADMMDAAIQEYTVRHNLVLDKVTKIPLEGEGSIESRVNKLFHNWSSSAEWVQDLHAADAIFVATHSQGCVASTQLLDKLIQDGHIYSGNNLEQVKEASVAYDFKPRRSPQKICLLGLCGVHHGPFHWLNTSTVVNPYLTYFESPAARELFEFQDSESAVSKAYAAALRRVLDHGIKVVYVASLDDQVVPIYSASFVAASHPLILRALYMDGDAYSSSDFLSNLLVLLFRIQNAGLDDGGLLAHLSEATAGSLSGVGHSSAYEEIATYSLAVRFLFETSGPMEISELKMTPFQARASRNDYMIPWALRGLIEDVRISALFGPELAQLRSAFDQWQPKTANLREVRRKLEPIRQSPTTSAVHGDSRGTSSRL